MLLLAQRSTKKGVESVMKSEGKAAWIQAGDGDLEHKHIPELCWQQKICFSQGLKAMLFN